MKNYVWKRVCAALLAGVIVAGFAACSSAQEEPETTTESITQTEPAEPTQTEAATDTQPHTQSPTQETLDPQSNGTQTPAPSTKAEMLAMYTSALQKSAALRVVKESRLLHKGELAGTGIFAGKSYQLTEDENARRVIESSKAGKNTLQLPQLAAGQVASAACKENGSAYMLSFSLSAANGSGEQLKDGTGGYFGFIDYTQGVTLTKEIGKLFGFDVKIQGVSGGLSNGVLSVTVDKASGKVTSAQITYREQLDIQLRYIVDIKANIVCDFDLQLAV